MSGIIGSFNSALVAPDAGTEKERNTVLFKYWWPVLAGLCLLYAPTYVDLVQGLWAKPEYAHGPILLLVSCWLIWRSRHHLIPKNCSTQPATGLVLLVVGLGFFVLGRSQQILFFEIGSQVPVLIGVLMFLIGAKSTRHFLVPILFLFFLVPVPSLVVDLMTTPLKQYVSMVVVNMLYLLDYPVGQSGVVLTIGPYQLLVADACSGIKSMFALSALSLLYIYLRGRSSRFHNLVLLTSIIPIAFATNVIRVMALCLITYYAGDAAGQGVAHHFTGVIEFILALLMLFGLDALLNAVSRCKEGDA